MYEEIQSLIESLRQGDYEDPQPRIERLASALRESRVDTRLVASLLGAPEIALRLAGLEGCRGREDSEILVCLAKVASDPEAVVRRKLAEVLGSAPSQRGLNTLRRLLRDSDGTVRAAAVRATAGEPGFMNVQRVLIRRDPVVEVRLAALEALAAQEPPVIVAALVDLLCGDAVPGEEGLVERCVDLAESRVAEAGEEALEALPEAALELQALESSVRSRSGQRAPRLLEAIQRRLSAVDPEALRVFGTDLTELALRGELPRAMACEEAAGKVLDILLGGDPRSVALLGESGCGKTALVHELVHELLKPERGGWRVLRVTPNDLLAGTKYIGEWESRIHALLGAVRRPRRVLVYIPSLADLSGLGTYDKSDYNAAAALAPHIDEGSLLVLGESTPQEFHRGLGSVPSLQRVFEKVVLQEASPEATRRIAAAIRDESGVDLPDAVLDQLIELADHYVGSTVRPGKVLGLLRGVLAGHLDPSAPVTQREVLEAVSKSTGLPTDLLDDDVSLSLRGVREFFESRVMGQPEAIDAVVDLVTLIKAGLTDPNRPFGVFLFIGPTGVGKTELARTLAEFIFGDPRRLKRFDMSEFASYEGFERLIGVGTRGGLLTEAVRQSPFSVVLLDEIEKSHVNVFDLCLQIFDAGRLTDGQGRTIDFRRTILVLTSNIGSSSPPAAPMGFGQSGEAAAPVVDRERTFRELTRVFRPEFLNRIDRIVNFRPLSLEVAEGIARKEIQAVLQRSGMVRRGLAVDIAPAVLALLVREGYSPHFGARPLKRAVERLVLLPLGRVIATGRVHGSAVLRLSEKDGQTEVEVSAEPRSAAAAPREPRPPLSLRETSLRLSEDHASLERQIEPFVRRKSELVRRAQDPEFYSDPRNRAETFDEIHKLEQFLSLQRTFGIALEKVARQIEGGPRSRAEEHVLEERLEELASELRHLRAVACARDARDLGDALLSVSLVDRSGESQAAVERLARMYCAFSRRRGMTAEVLAERCEGADDVAFLQLSGLGAFGLLKGESGLHRVDRRQPAKSSRAGRERPRKDSELVRVEVVPFRAVVEGAFRARLKAKVQPLKPSRSRLLEKASLDISLFHEPSLRSVRAWAEGPQAGALETLQQILLSQVEAPEPPQSTSRGWIVRHYDLGRSPKVRDLRTGRSTSQVERVLQGRMDLLIDAEGQD